MDQVNARAKYPKTFAYYDFLMSEMNMKGSKYDIESKIEKCMVIYIYHDNASCYTEDKMNQNIEKTTAVMFRQLCKLLKMYRQQ